MGVVFRERTEESLVLLGRETPVEPEKLLREHAESAVAAGIPVLHKHVTKLAFLMTDPTTFEHARSCVQDVEVTLLQLLVHVHATLGGAGKTLRSQVCGTAAELTRACQTVVDGCLARPPPPRYP